MTAEELATCLVNGCGRPMVGFAGFPGGAVWMCSRHLDTARAAGREIQMGGHEAGPSHEAERGEP